MSDRNENSLNSTLSFLGHSSMDMSMGSSSSSHENDPHHEESTTLFTSPPPPMQRAEEEEEVGWDVESVRTSLRKAVLILNQYCLKLASKWASEQLLGLLAEQQQQHSSDPPSKNIHDLDHPTTMTMMMMSDDKEMYAKSLLDMGEYFRAADMLSIPEKHNHSHNRTMSPPLPNLSPIGIFYRAYALYMAGERRKEEEVVELRDPLERTTLRNIYLTQLATELEIVYDKLDAFGLWILGVILKELKKHPVKSTFNNNNNDATKKYTTTTTTTTTKTNKLSAHLVLIQSIRSFPFNWSAWLDLADLCIQHPTTLQDQIEQQLAPLHTHWMYHFFCIHIFLEEQANEQALQLIDRLTNGLFVNSPHLQTQRAMAHYNLRDFTTAQAHFQPLLKQQPHRLDAMDVYSNILYVKEDRVALSALAHHAVQMDKYRPETCCIVGNYYSLKGQHEKAVQYFQRALKLDRTYLSAWTLMGHEYVEMKNTAAAIEAYRRAVDIHPRDYRAWYGLGQTYEIMNMPLYALFYYRKAAALRPYDPRMWSAMGGCFLLLEKKQDAIRCYERAVSHKDAEGIATRKLAMMYQEDGQIEKAARCFLRHLELRYQAQLASQQQQQQQQQTPLKDMAADTHSSYGIKEVFETVHVDAPEAEALLYLSYYYKDNGQLDIASTCCSRLLEYPGPEKEEGKALLREIRSRMDLQQNASRNNTVVDDTTTTMRPRVNSNRNSMTNNSNSSTMDEEDSIRNLNESSFNFSP